VLIKEGALFPTMRRRIIGKKVMEVSVVIVKQSLARTTSQRFFFANFPNGYGEIDMIKVLPRWARVKEVFISRRRNKWGRRFGFVRFFEVRNVRRLQRDLDQIYIGNLKLHVNIPRYRRNEADSKGAERNPRVDQKEMGRNSRKRKVETHGVIEKKKTKEVWKAKLGRKSFVEVVKGKAHKRWKGLVINSECQVLPWMVNSVIGQFRAELGFEQLCDDFVKGGMSMVRVRFLGDNRAFLTPKEGESMEELINLNKEWFESVFQTIVPWSEEYVVGHKVVWVRCFGLPLAFWNKDCFYKVVG